MLTGKRITRLQCQRNRYCNAIPIYIGEVSKIKVKTGGMNIINY
jgi:hypothetical protein